MSKELYNRMDTAAKFVGEQPTIEISHQDQTATGLEWAQRQQQRPAPEPVVALKPIVPVA